jgi:hypothetical protein
MARGLVYGAIAAALGTVVASVAVADPEPQASDSRVEQRIGELRVGLAFAGLVLFAEGARRRRRGIAEARGSGRRVMLGVVAGLAFAANYNLFVGTAIHRHEFFHYYLGSKYFPELGYFDLYACSVQVIHGDGPLPADLTEITDLRSKRRRPAAEVMAAAPRCRDAFSAERWAAFGVDLESFHTLLGDAGFHRVLRDHGYNPSPAWTLIGGALAAQVPPTPLGLWLLARIDLALLALLFGALGWTFGFDAMCVAAIAWGASGHTRYQWTGDAFLRHLWLATSVIGVCLLARRRPAASGAFVAMAALERVFPACFFLGYGLRELCVWIRERRATRGFWRFVAGAGVATIAIAAAGTIAAGRGLPVWLDFAENTRGMLAFKPKNSLGLEYGLRFTSTAPPDWKDGTETEREELIQAHKERTLEERRGWQIGALALFGALFAGACWRGARRDGDGRLQLSDWEAVAMGSAAIPFLTMPGSYYLGFIILGAPLATRRPRIAIALLAATLGWAVCVIQFPGRALGYAVSSWILVAFSVWMLVELWLPAQCSNADSPPPTSAPASPRGGG